jgi:nicotinate-nucleotide adenylyltransferase
MVEATREERIGLFGGTFNPVHRGHLRAAQAVRSRFRLNRVLFIPSYLPPHKQTTEMASPQNRFAMVELAVSAFPRLVASPLEIEARERSYSIITLNKIRTIYPEAWIFFILGIDAFLEIETWKSYREVLEQCRFIIISRPGFDLAAARGALPSDYEKSFHHVPEGEELGNDFLEKFRFFLLLIPALDISSTEIRRRVRCGRSIRGLVPESVEEYIRRKKLYQE